ncbi:MAG TPA: hypothetical protein VF648_06605 [Pyrinomonadaceae bacterium]|jgi:hypothetical protein
MLVSEQAQIIEQKYFKKQDVERIERLKLSINTTAELIGKGFEVHPSVTTPENVTNLFPDFRSIHLPNPETKQISTGDNEENKP